MTRVSFALTLMACCLASSAAALNADAEIGILACTLSEPTQSVTSAVPSTERTREAACTFRTNAGAEETYAGKFYGISITAEGAGTAIFVVRSPLQANAQPGALQQVFASDSSKPADQKPPLVGEGNAQLALHSFSDKPEDSASAAQKPAASGFAILRIELKLQSSAG